MSGPIDTAMVMAAGLGTRMRPLTDDRPKALVEVDRKALIDHMLDRLVEAGITKAVVNVHAHADRLEAHLKARVGAPEIVISDERDGLLETGGALVKARDVLPGGPIVVANIDSVWMEDIPGQLTRLITGYDAQTMDARLLMAAHGRSMGYHGQGDFLMDPLGRVTRRPFGDVAPFVYAGVQVFHMRLVEGFALEKFSLNRMWDPAIAAGRVFGMRLEGEWMHVGDPEARRLAERRLRHDEDA